MPTAALDYAIRDNPEAHRFEVDLGSFAIAESSSQFLVRILLDPERKLPQAQGVVLK
jgi:hypothetical protein